MSPTYKLYYFNARGRAEIARTLLAISGVEFEDIRFTTDEYAPKYKHLAPFGQSPFLEICDGNKTETIAQSMAIARYLARTLRWAGESALEEAQISMVADCIEDYLLTPCPAIRRQKDPQQKEKMLKTYTEETVPSALSMLERQLVKNQGGDQWFIGKKMSWADISLAHWIGWMPGGVGVTAPLEKYPKLQALVARVEAHPGVASWMKRRPATAN